MENRRATIKKLTIRELLKPHVTALTIGFIAVVGEGVANLLEPWPLKIVLDSVLRSRPAHGWLNQFIQATVGGDQFAILKFACAAVLGIAVLDAVSSYTEKYFTTSVGQWVTHDLRRTLYSRIQQLSLAYHDQKRSGDLISRVTSDIDAIQSFINTGLLGALINLITLVGMIGVMWTLYLTNTTLNIESFMGIIVMVGIVVSNSILLVDFANQRRREGHPLRRAVVDSARIRMPTSGNGFTFACKVPAGAAPGFVLPMPARRRMPTGGPAMPPSLRTIARHGSGCRPVSTAPSW